MLRSLKDLEGYTVKASDGEVGTVADFLLDDEGWTIRYLVVKTGGFFEEREVLISPMFFREVAWAAHSFQLALTRAKIKASPDAQADLPVSRQHERNYYRYYGYPSYWGSAGILDLNTVQMPPVSDEEIARTEAKDDAHLRSCRCIRGYHLQGLDEEIGHVEDFIVDDETWQIRYLVVNTSNWWVGKKVLVPPFWATRISWETSMIDLALTRKEIQHCPEWDANAAVNRSYEVQLFDYYGRPVYWDPSAPGQPVPPVRNGPR